MWRRRPAPAPTQDGWTVVLDLLFPDGLDAGQAARIRDVVDGRPPSVVAARRALGVLDQQTASSPVLIRWGHDDLHEVDVDGCALTLDRADASVSIQIADGAYEPHVAATLDRLLGPGDVFVDVGANVGFHTVRAARSVGGGGRVVAVEANPENARLIAHTVDRNDLDNVEILPFALAGRLGHVTFGSHIGSNGGFLAQDAATASSGRGTLVPTITMDGLGLDRIDVVKIDVEGAEALVIDGSVGVIERHRPTFVMEFSVEMTRRVSERDPREHLARFGDWGYSIAVIDRHSHQPIGIESVDVMLADWGDLVRIEDLLLTPND